MNPFAMKSNPPIKVWKAKNLKVKITPNEEPAEKYYITPGLDLRGPVTSSPIVKMTARLYDSAKNLAVIVESEDGNKFAIVLELTGDDEKQKDLGFSGGID